MKTEEYINLVKDRYYSLNLTFEQAEKIYHYEQDKSHYSNKHHFSNWEEWDYELTVFKEILNEEQFSHYENFLKDNIQRHEQDLIRQDEERTSDMLLLEEQIAFYEKEFLPSVFKHWYIRDAWMMNEKSKVDYLRSEYQNFLNETKKQMLTQHFRHYRRFKPNELKVSLLRHQFSSIFPQYDFFEHQMDQPTKTVADYLKKIVRRFPDDIEELLTEKLEEVKAFNEKLFDKYYGDIKGSVWIVRKENEDEERIGLYMSLLLINPEKYKIDNFK